MSRLTRPLWVLLALLFLAEAWTWDHLGPWIRRGLAALPLTRLKAWLEVKLAALPPYLALFVFLLGSLVLAPFKLLEVWLVAHHHYVALVLLFLALKTVGVGLTAFLFGVLKPNLMRIGWFVRLYDLTLRARRWAEIQVQPAMARLRAVKAQILAAMPQGLVLRRAQRLRRRMARRGLPAQP